VARGRVRLPHYSFFFEKKTLHTKLFLFPIYEKGLFFAAKKVFKLFKGHGVLFLLLPQSWPYCAGPRAY
jgi:hypothetical protein